jgi:Ni,Fe-hydrogenase I large subunit
MAAFSRLRAALSGGGDPFQPGSADPRPQIAVALSSLGALVSVSSERVLGTSPAGWLERAADAGGLRAWSGAADTAAARLVREVEARGWAALGRSPVQALPRLSAAELEGLLGGRGADAFVAAPRWRGRPAESSPFARNLGQPLVAGLSRRCHNGLLPRLAAQLAELSGLLVGLRQGIEDLGSQATTSVSPARGTLPPGVGIAQVQAARGLLVHRLAIRDDRVRDYRILAPTEWNFHPKGAVAAGLAGLPPMGGEQLLGFAGLFVTAVDPCVDHVVTVT